MAELVSVFPIFDLPWIETLIIIFSVFCFLLTRKVRNVLSSKQTELNPHLCINDKQSQSVINNDNTSQGQHNEDSGQHNKTQPAQKQNTNSTTCGQNGANNQRLQQNGQNKALTLKDALNVAGNSHSLLHTKPVEGWDDETENIETPYGKSTSQLQQQYLNEGKSVEQNTGASSDLPKSLHSRMPNEGFTVAHTTDDAHNTELNANVLNENQNTKTTFDGQNAASSNDAQILLVSGHDENDSVKRAQTTSIFDVENLKSKELMQNKESTVDLQIKDTLLAEQCVNLEQSVAHAQKAEVSSDALFPHLNQYCQKQRSHDAQNEETNLQSHQSKQENHNCFEQIKEENAPTHAFNDTQNLHSNLLFLQNTESRVYVGRNETDVQNWLLHQRQPDEEPADRTQNVENLGGEKKSQLQQSDQSHTINQNVIGSPSSLQEKQSLIGEQRAVSYTSENNIDALKIKAEQLGLVIFSVPGNTMLGAIEDQLRVLNPNGHYELRRENISHEYQENASDWNGWPQNSESLQHIANLHKRNIEIVHSDMLGSMIIRPLNMRNRARQTLYIGYDSQGCYYSLRPVDANPTTQNGTACSTDSYDFTETVGNGSSATGTAAAIGQKYNILVGDDCTQFVIQMPAKDKDEEEYTEITNVVIGEGNTQNVVVTFRTAKSIVEFLKKNYTKETFSEQRLKLKIRIECNSLTEDQMHEKVKTTIEMLQDASSETRSELDLMLKEDFGVIFESAMEGCMLINLLALSQESFMNFVERYKSGEIIGIIVFILSTLKFRQEQNIDVDVQIGFTLKKAARKCMENDLKQVALNDQKERVQLRSRLKANNVHQTSMGISMLFRRSSITPSDRNINGLAEQVTRAILCGKRTSLLPDNSSQVDVVLEPFSFQSAVRKPVEWFQHNEVNVEIILDRLRGKIGIIRDESGVKGTCFRVGPFFLLTALHVIQTSKQTSEDMSLHLFEVYFPDTEDTCVSNMVYSDTRLDVAMLRINGDVMQQQTEEGTYFADCLPGLPFYVVGYPNGPNGLGEKQSAERVVVEISPINTVGTLKFKSLEFGPGCSGSPGVIVIGDRFYFVSMLQGRIISQKGITCWGVKLADVYHNMIRAIPDLAPYLQFVSRPFNKILLEQAYSLGQARRRTGDVTFRHSWPLNRM